MTFFKGIFRLIITLVTFPIFMIIVLIDLLRAMGGAHYMLTDIFLGFIWRD